MRMPDFSSEEFLTVAEVAGMPRLNQQTIRNWIDQGKLPAVRIGRRVRVLRSDFEQLVNAGYRSPEKQPSPADGTPANRV
jgi:excisionase family DNA binding protein